MASSSPTLESMVDRLELPLTPLRSPSWLDALLGIMPVKALLPIPLIALLAIGIYFMFRRTWREIDEEATHQRLSRLSSGTADYRPAVCLTIVAVVLTLQEYYGGRQFYEGAIRPWLQEMEAAHPERVNMAKWGDLYAYVWWVSARVIGYVLIPFPVWKLIFPQDSLLDMGLRVRGFLSHLWIYGLCLLVVLPATWVVAHQPDFGGYYPFYKLSSRSVMDLLLWELIYGIQFFALELFFRGFMLGALRPSLGSGAIFAMAVPYCMIHYGKPYLEAHGAIVAGVVLGSLAMKTRSIYAGFLVHITVAYLMDLASLWQRKSLPTTLWPN